MVRKGSEEAIWEQRPEPESWRAPQQMEQQVQRPCGREEPGMLKEPQEPMCLEHNEERGTGGG